MKMKLVNNRKKNPNIELKVMEVMMYITKTSKVRQSRPKSITKPSSKGALEGVEKIWHLKEPINMLLVLTVEEHWPLDKPCPEPPKALFYHRNRINKATEASGYKLLYPSFKGVKTRVMKFTSTKVCYYKIHTLSSINSTSSNNKISNTTITMNLPKIHSKLL